MKEFSGKTVLVTGAASGIGRGMVLDFAKEGADLVLWDIDEEGLKSVAEEVRQIGTKANMYKLDLSKKNEIAKQAAKVKSDVGHIDLLINNAGIVTGKSFLECSDEQIERTMNVNIMALMWITREFLPDMLERDSGHIVNVASAAGLIGVSALADYSASKFAVIGFNESIRMELKKNKSNVKTTVVCPYYINTGMFNGVKTRFSFLLPILEEKKVVTRVLESIKKEKSSLLMPWIVNTVPPLRLLPDSVFDFAANLLGLNNSMDEFKGRNS